jgi:hypothetical protein
VNYSLQHEIHNTPWYFIYNIFLLQGKLALWVVYLHFHHAILNCLIHPKYVFYQLGSSSPQNVLNLMKGFGVESCDIWHAHEMPYFFHIMNLYNNII